jgi:hypothetical protein
MASNFNFVDALDIVELIERAAADGVVGAANGVAAIAAAFGAQLGNKGDLKATHEEVGRRMIAATLDRYDTNVEGRKEQEERSSPARNKGKLRDALEDGRMVQATASGVSFVNIAILRARANHYRRLNFGTKGIGYGGQQSPTVPFTLFGTYLTGLSFNQDSRPAFVLPPGMFLAGGQYSHPSGSKIGTGQFVPLGELPRRQAGHVASRVSKGLWDEDKPTAGIRPRYFLEAGIEQFSEAIPQEYDLLVQSWLDKGNKPGQAYLDTIKVRGGANRITNFGSKSLRVTA